MEHFENFIKKNYDELSRKLIMLKRTTFITDEHKEDPLWKLLDFQYKDNQDLPSTEKAVISIMNSAATQRRVVFIISRPSLQKMMKEDKNWKGSKSFRHESYAEVIQSLCHNNLCKQIGIKGSFGVYELTQPAVLEYLNIDKKQQLKECYDWIEEQEVKPRKSKKKKSGDSLGDKSRDRFGDTEYESENEYEKDTSGKQVTSGGRNDPLSEGGSSSPKINNIPDTTPDDEWDYSNVPNHDRHGNYIPPPEERKALEECKIALRGFGGSEPKIHHPSTSPFGETWDVAIEMIKKEQAENANKPPMLHGELDWQYEERIAEEALANDPEYQESKRKFEELL